MGYFGKREEEMEKTRLKRPLETDIFRYKIVKDMLTEDPELRKEIRRFLETLP